MSKAQNDTTSAETLQAELNRQKALELKLAGATFRDIAKALGVSVSTAHGYVKDWLDDIRAENAELANDVKRIALARLNKMRMSLWSKREQPRVADTLLRIDEREARLLGLDAPLRWEGSGPGGGPIPVSGEIDLSKLTVDQLKQLEEIVLAAQNAAIAAAPIAKIAEESIGEGQERRIGAGYVEPLSTNPAPAVTDQASSNNGSHP